MFAPPVTVSVSMARGLARGEGLVVARQYKVGHTGLKLNWTTAESAEI